MSGYEIKGDKKLLKQLKKNAEMKDIINTVRLNGAELHKKAMRSAPVDTGNLKRSIQIEKGNNGLSARIYPTASYSSYLEYGTRFMDAQPFLKPNFLTQEIQFIKDLQRLMK